MQQLSGLDNIFLTLEDSRQHVHIASLGLYDPSSAEGGAVRFKTMLDFFANRAEEVPFFRRRLVKVPYGIDRPYWVDDAGINIEYHVRHVALPAPGDWRQLMIQVARIHSRALDHSRPLWEAYVIGGLNNIEGIKKGSFALYLKMHHAAVDGQAAAQLIQILHTVNPEYKSHSSASVVMTDREPNAIELALRTAAHRGKQVIDATRLSAEIAKVSISMGSKYGSEAIDKLRTTLLEKFTVDRTSTPQESSSHNAASAGTRFDRPISPHRAIDAIGIPLENCKTIREHIHGATINDIFMATCGGALRKYLEAHGEMPETSVNAMMPIATPGNQGSGNNVASALVSLHSDIVDPIERISEIKKSTARAKELQEAMGPDLLARLIDVLPAAVAVKLLQVGIQANASLTVSNVRGPDVPLYLAGAKCQMFVPVSFPADNMGLNITGFSYYGTLWISINVCRDMMPDPDFFSQCMRDAFAELQHAAQALGKKSNLRSSGRARRPKTTARKPRARKVAAKKKATTTHIS